MYAKPNVKLTYNSTPEVMVKKWKIFAVKYLPQKIFTPKLYSPL